MRYATAGRILVVDDEPQNVAVLRRLRTRLGYEVLTAGADGEPCVQSFVIITSPEWPNERRKFQPRL